MKREQKAKAAKRTGRPLAIRGPIAELAKAVGGLNLLEAATGIATRTLRDYAYHGIPERAKVQRKMLQQVAKKHGVGGIE